MRQFVCFLFFLVYANDLGTAYSDRLDFGPVTWVQNHLLPDAPIHVRTFDLVMAVVLALAASKKDGARRLTRPMKNALFLMLATTSLWFFYGVARGGDANAAGWQVYLILSTVLVSFALAAVLRTPQDFVLLGKWLLVAALYHATMCWVSYFTWARSLVGGEGAYLTRHDDTIVWVASILMLIINVIDRRSLLVSMRNGLFGLFILGAIQWNSRRIAWISLAISLVVLYALFPAGRAKAAVKRAARVVVPVIALYVIVGWGRPNRIFLPLRSISSVSNEADSSTLARNAENLGLIATANSSNVVTGTGWGHPYIALTTKYDISEFKLWRYVPHNSILMLLAFTGGLGFTGFWMSVPISVFFNARVARVAKDPKARSVSILGAAQVVICGVQLYGDMGLFSPQTMYALAISYAIALRLPAQYGAWNSRPKTASHHPESGKELS